MSVLSDIEAIGIAERFWAEYGDANILTLLATREEVRAEIERVKERNTPKLAAKLEMVEATLDAIIEDREAQP